MNNHPPAGLPGSKGEPPMLNLEPSFARLPVPKPKSTPAAVLKTRLRLPALWLAGRALTRRASKTAVAQRTILLIRPDHMGDLLFATPAIRYLRELLPQAHLALMVGPWGRPVMQSNPYLNQILSCDFPGFTRRPKPSPGQPYRYLRQQAALLRRHRFDQAIILRFDHWWGAWLAAAAHIPRRFGYAAPGV
ncbi:MAG: glycosyltransferase family 9 protein, partial [Anaerolineae bacterium]